MTAWPGKLIEEALGAVSRRRKVGGRTSGPRTEDEAEPTTSTFFEDAFPVRLRRASEAMEEVARLLLGESNLPGFTEMRILAYLEAKGSVSGGEISRNLRVDNAWISRLLHALRRRGLVVQARDPSDQRVILTSLTDAGRTLHLKTIADVGRCNGAIMDGLDEARSIEMLERLEANLRSIARRIRSQDESVFEY